MNSKRLGALGILLMLVVTSIGVGIVYFQKDVPMTATVKLIGTIGFYSDSGCTTPIDTYGWGEFDISSGQQNKTLLGWIKNLGNVNVNVSWCMTDPNLTWVNADYYFINNAWQLMSYKDQTKTVLWCNANSTDVVGKYIVITKGSVVPVCLWLQARPDASITVPLDFIVTIIANSPT